jgi:hypothetical protein
VDYRLDSGGNCLICPMRALNMLLYALVLYGDRSLPWDVVVVVAVELAPGPCSRLREIS